MTMPSSYANTSVILCCLTVKRVLKKLKTQVLTEAAGLMGLTYFYHPLLQEFMICLFN